MSREYGTVKGPHRIRITGYHGGEERGRCLQLTGYNCDDKLGYISLTANEAERLYIKLREWAIWGLDEVDDADEILE
jgi:hypothetical protein